MAEYQFAIGSRVGGDPQEIGEALESLRRDHGGIVEAEHVVEHGAEPSSPFHEALEWDDDAAAHSWRVVQAGKIIRSVRLVTANPDGSSEAQIAYVHVAPKGYTTTEVAMSDESLRAGVLQDALRALSSWQSRYGHLREIANSALNSAIDALLIED
tara:strand:+ start:3192 stop:3659 length:468 start_codon:yes stop_codon:yes gene_type:complete